MFRDRDFLSSESSAIATSPPPAAGRIYGGDFALKN
jgi:hypothetical protein